MKKMCMTYKECLKRRLERKKQDMIELERLIEKDGVPTSIDKRKYVEIKAAIQELELCIDLADSMFDE